MNTDILLRVQDHIATLTFNRPQSLNSLSLDSIQSLLHQLRDLSVRRDVRALVLTGQGRGFCAGWQLDMDQVPGIEGESLGVRQSHLMAEYFNPVIEALNDCPFPTLAAVNGVSAGAGVSLALACDVVIAHQSASFVMTFAPRLGLIPDLGATWKMPRLVGWARAQATALLGERISADQAAQWGMIWRAVSDADFQSAVAETASRLSLGPPGIAKEVRHAHHAAQTHTLAQQLDFERQRQRVLLDSPHFLEGVAAFAQKREPKFSD
jgi:2-(1,2-epoxy-1,2-dihydrophenyl)acetyl-CoA isomerase